MCSRRQSPAQRNPARPLSPLSTELELEGLNENLIVGRASHEAVDAVPGNPPKERNQT
jgi:hypothetical protein